MVAVKMTAGLAAALLLFAAFGHLAMADSTGTAGEIEQGAFAVLTVDGLTVFLRNDDCENVSYSVVTKEVVVGQGWVNARHGVSIPVGEKTLYMRCLAHDVIYEIY